MTVVDDTTMLDRHLGCLREVSAILQKYDLCDAVKLVIVREDVTLAENEVLVQQATADGRGLSLTPKLLADLEAGDVVHASQVLDAGDAEFMGYVEEIRAASCLVRYDLNGRPVHIYD
jgi:hypothetical protein